MSQKVIIVKKVNRAVRREKDKIFKQVAKEMFEQKLWDQIKTAILIIRG